MGAVFFLRRERDSAGLAAIAISVPFQGACKERKAAHDLTVARAVSAYFVQ